MAVSVIDATPIIPSSDHICELYLQISMMTTFWGHDVSSLAQKKVCWEQAWWMIGSISLENLTLHTFWQSNI